MALGYASWRGRRIEELERASEVVETARGPVELARRGQAPFVLLFHGGPGGHDQGFAADALLRAGFGVLAPSRPGYLRTPLESGRTTGLENDLLQLAAIGRLPFEEVRCPALVAHGTADADVPFADAEVAAREMPKAELLRVENGWHLLNLSDGAEDFERAQVDFLRKHVS